MFLLPLAHPFVSRPKNVEEEKLRLSIKDSGLSLYQKSVIIYMKKSGGTSQDAENASTLILMQGDL